MRAWALPIIISLFAGPVFAQNPEPVNTKQLDRRTQILMSQSDLTGLAVAIVEDGEITFTKGYGTRQRGRNLPITKDTVFRWASVSKGVAAATLLGLVEDGRVDPTRPIEDLAPSLVLPESDTKHDIVDLLSHRIGISRNAYDGKIEDGRPPKPLRTELGELDYVCAPRTCHTYQNVAFDAAAEIIEEATELPYKAIVQTEVFDAIGMETASLTREAMYTAKNWARPHGRRGQSIDRLKPHYYRVPAAAGINSSVEDLAKWMIALMPDAETETSIPESRLTAMQTAIVPTPREQRMMNRRYSRLKNSHYGLGLRVYNYEGRKVVGHRGGVEGYRALILFDPEQRSGIAMMWNSPHSQPIGLSLEFLDQLYGLPRQDWLRLSKNKS